MKTAVDDNHARVSTLETYVTADGNLVLENSTASSGNIMKDTTSFIHDFGIGNTFLGLNAGNFTMTGTSNTVVGHGAFFNNTSGGGNTVIGAHALQNNTTGNNNSGIGSSVLVANTSGSVNVA